MKLTLTTMPALVNATYKSGRGSFYKSADAKQSQEAMQWEAKTQYRGKPLVGDLKVSLDFFYNDKRRRDIDGGIKSTLDAMTGVLWNDDSQIVSLNVHKKIDKANPRVELCCSVI